MVDAPGPVLGCRECDRQQLGAHLAQLVAAAGGVGHALLVVRHVDIVGDLPLIVALVHGRVLGGHLVRVDAPRPLVPVARHRGVGGARPIHAAEALVEEGERGPSGSVPLRRLRVVVGVLQLRLRLVEPPLGEVEHLLDPLRVIRPVPRAVRETLRCGEHRGGRDVAAVVPLHEGRPALLADVALLLRDAVHQLPPLLVVAGHRGQVLAVPRDQVAPARDALRRAGGVVDRSDPAVATDRVDRVGQLVRGRHALAAALRCRGDVGVERRDVGVVGDEPVVPRRLGDVLVEGCRLRLKIPDVVLAKPARADLERARQRQAAKPPGAEGVCHRFFRRGPRGIGTRRGKLGSTLPTRPSLGILTFPRRPATSGAR